MQKEEHCHTSRISFSCSLPWRALSHPWEWLFNLNFFNTIQNPFFHHSLQKSFPLCCGRRTLCYTPPVVWQRLWDGPHPGTFLMAMERSWGLKYQVVRKFIIWEVALRFWEPYYILLSALKKNASFPFAYTVLLLCTDSPWWQHVGLLWLQRGSHRAASPVAEHRSRRTVSEVVAHGLRCSTACGIFLAQGLNLFLLHWQVDSYPLYYQGSPI